MRLVWAGYTNAQPFTRQSQKCRRAWLDVPVTQFCRRERSWAHRLDNASVSWFGESRRHKVRPWQSNEPQLCSVLTRPRGRRFRLNLQFYVGYSLTYPPRPAQHNFSLGREGRCAGTRHSSLAVVCPRSEKSSTIQRRDCQSHGYAVLCLGASL